MKDYLQHTENQDETTLLINSKQYNPPLGPYSYLRKPSEYMLAAPRYFLRALVYLAEPRPGQHTESFWSRLFYGSLIRVAAFFSAVVLFAVNIPLVPVSMMGLILRVIEMYNRPAILYYEYGCNNSPQNLNHNNETHIETFNVAFVPDIMAVGAKLRPPLERAKEIANGINNATDQPDVIFLQELFHQDARDLLFKEVADNYPYQILEALPNNGSDRDWVYGFTSGQGVLSKYLLIKEYQEFIKFDNMTAPDNKAKRGILRFAYKKHDTLYVVYNAHIQSFLGPKRSEVRKEQIKAVNEKMANDLEKGVFKDHTGPIVQITGGDFNLSRVTFNGLDCTNPVDQKENKVLKYIDKKYNDPYTHDHDKVTNRRTQSQSMFHPKEPEKEPHCSWNSSFFNEYPFYVGWLLYLENLIRGYPNISSKPIKDQHPEITNSHDHTRFDYMLFNKAQVANHDDKNQYKLYAKQEIGINFVDEPSHESDHKPFHMKCYVETDPNKQAKQEFANSFMMELKKPRL